MINIQFDEITHSKQWSYRIKIRYDFISETSISVIANALKVLFLATLTTGSFVITCDVDEIFIYFNNVEDAMKARLLVSNL